MINILKTRKLEHWHKIALMLMLYDIVAVNISYFFGTVAAL